MNYTKDPTGGKIKNHRTNFYAVERSAIRRSFCLARQPLHETAWFGALSQWNDERVDVAAVVIEAADQYLDAPLQMSQNGEDVVSHFGALLSECHGVVTEGDCDAVSRDCLAPVRSPGWSTDMNRADRGRTAQCRHVRVAVMIGYFRQHLCRDGICGDQREGACRNQTKEGDH